MAQPKGKTGNPNGRPTGSKNERTLQWEALGHALLTRHAERAESVMAKLPDDKFIDNYIKLLEYFKPKQARSEVTQSGEQTLTIVHTYDSHDQDSEATQGAAGTTEQP